MFSGTVLIGIVLLVSSALFAYLLNEILYKYSRNLGVHTQDENVVRWASTTKPTIGGISFFIAFILASLVFFVTTQGRASDYGSFLALITVVTLGFFIGLQDDAYNTRPLLKFMGQVTCAVIMIIYGVHIRIFAFEPLNYFLTIFWVVGIMNSINLLDNMDGVTATVSLTIVGVAIARILIFPRSLDMDPFLFALIACVGAFIGFLILNWHPSKIYMGDTGSQFLGALLAFIGVKFFWNVQVQVGNHVEYADVGQRILIPIMVFMVPIMDTTFVTVARIMRGQSPFVGGKDHLTHNMNYLGVAENRVPIVLGIVSLASGMIAIFGLKYLHILTSWHTMLFAAFVVICFVVFFLLFKRGERIGLAKQRFSRTFHRAFLERQKRDEIQSGKQEEKQHS